MAARFATVLLLLLALAAPLQVGASPLGRAAPGVPEAQLSAGTLHAGIDGDQARVATGSPLAIEVNETVALPLLPDLSLQVHPQGAARHAQQSHADGSASALAPRSLSEEPPSAFVAGTSLVATLIGIAACLVKVSFGLFSRIEDDALARHPLRRQALDFIAANPGATLQDVRRGLGVAWGTAVYHLGRLERAGLVAVRRSGGRRGHWPLGQAPSHDALSPTGAVLARLVRECPGLAQNELARRAGIGPPAACKQLRRLESAGVVQTQRSGKARLYLPDERLADFLPTDATV